MPNSAAIAPTMISWVYLQSSTPFPQRILSSTHLSMHRLSPSAQSELFDLGLTRDGWRWTLMRSSSSWRSEPQFRLSVLPFTSLHPSLWGMATSMCMRSTARAFVSWASSRLWPRSGPLMGLDVVYGPGHLRCWPALCWPALWATVVASWSSQPCVAQRCGLSRWVLRLDGVRPLASAALGLVDRDFQ
jgi:hypothetical protein